MVSKDIPTNQLSGMQCSNPPTVHRVFCVVAPLHQKTFSCKADETGSRHKFQRTLAQCWARKSISGFKQHSFSWKLVGLSWTFVCRKLVRFSISHSQIKITLAYHIMSFRLTFHSTQNSCSSSIASARASGSHRPKSFPAHRSKTDLYSTVLNQCCFSNRRKFRCQPVKLAPPAGTIQRLWYPSETAISLTQAPSWCTLVTNEVGPPWSSNRPL